MRGLLVVAALVVAVSALRAEEPKRPITHEDVWTMRSIGAPAASPDGKWVVVSVTEPAYDPRNTVSDLWILSVSGDRPPRRLTANKAPETGVHWSADSSRIVFSSRRGGDDVAQIYMLDLQGGGEAERLTNVPTGARGPRWSPDGKRISFVSDVYPSAGDETTNREAVEQRKQRKYNARAYEQHPIRYWDRWLDETRPHLFVQDAVAGATARDLLANTWLGKDPGFAGKRTESAEELHSTWTPDGKGIVLVASTNADEAAYAEQDTDLFLIPADGGEPVRLTEDTDVYSIPVFSPDGKYLVLKSRAGGTGIAYNIGRIVRFPWPFQVEQRTVLTPQFDRDADDPVVAGDGTWVYFTAEEAGQEKIFGVDIEGGATQLEMETPIGVVHHLAGGGAGETFRLIAIWDAATQPPEVIARQPGDPTVRQLSQFNVERVANLDLFPVEHLWIQSSANRRIHSMIVRPAGFDPAKKYPVLALIHGGPHLMFRDSFVVRWNYHLLASTEYVVVLTNYTGSTGFGEAFSQAIHGDPLRTPANDVREVIDEVVRRYTFPDGTRVAAAGASYGGHIVNWLQATTTRFRCLVAHAGLVNLETQWATSDLMYSRELTNGGPIWEQGGAWREQNPIRLVGNHWNGTGWLTPILITAGERDYRVPLNNALETWSYLQRLKVPSRLVVFPDENHWILKGENSRYWYSEVNDWLRRWTGEAPPRRNDE